MLDMALEAVEQRFGKTSYPVEGLADNGVAYNMSRVCGRSS